MAVKAIGVDLVDENRFAEFDKRHTNMERLFSEEEIAYANGKKNTAEAFAAIFAAKEAVVKTLLAQLPDVTVRDIEIRHLQSGAPVVSVSDRIRESTKHLLFHLSVTHDAHLALAVCVTETE